MLSYTLAITISSFCNLLHISYSTRKLAKELHDHSIINITESLIICRNICNVWKQMSMSAIKYNKYCHNKMYTQLGQLFSLNIVIIYSTPTSKCAKPMRSVQSSDYTLPRLQWLYYYPE